MPISERITPYCLFFYTKAKKFLAPMPATLRTVLARRRAHRCERRAFVTRLRSSVRLILQPMTKAPQLRAYLAEAGFSVLKETVTEVSGKLYTCLCAEYTNTPHTLSAFEAEVGEYHISHPSPMGKKWAESRLKAMEKRLKALRDERDLALEAQIRRYIYDCENAV